MMHVYVILHTKLTKNIITSAFSEQINNVSVFGTGKSEWR